MIDNNNNNNNNNDNDLAEYDSSFLCTYQHIEDPDESDLCYKMQFLQAFGKFLRAITLVKCEKQILFSHLIFSTSAHFLLPMSVFFYPIISL